MRTRAFGTRKYPGNVRFVASLMGPDLRLRSGSARCVHLLFAFSLVCVRCAGEVVGGPPHESAQRLCVMQESHSSPQVQSDWVAGEDGSQCLQGSCL